MCEEKKPKLKLHQLPFNKSYSKFFSSKFITIPICDTRRHISHVALVFHSSNILRFVFSSAQRPLNSSWWNKLQYRQIFLLQKQQFLTEWYQLDLYITHHFLSERSELLWACFDWKIWKFRKRSVFSKLFPPTCRQISGTSVMRLQSYFTLVVLYFLPATSVNTPYLHCNMLFSCTNEHASALGISSTLP